MSHHHWHGGDSGQAGNTRSANTHPVVRSRRPSCRPDLRSPRPSRAAAVQDGRRPPRAGAARSVLDGREHGGILIADGRRCPQNRRLATSAYPAQKRCGTCPAKPPVPAQHAPFMRGFSPPLTGRAARARAKASSARSRRRSWRLLPHAP